MGATGSSSWPTSAPTVVARSLVRQELERSDGPYDHAVAAAPGSLLAAPWPVFDDLPVQVALSTRAGGVSSGQYESLNLGLHVGDDEAAVVENRHRLAASLGLALDDLVFAAQAHGREVLVVGPEHRGRGTRSGDDAVGPVDALVTPTPGLGIVVLVADCVPLVLYAPDVHAVACVHAGWRGIVAGVVGATIDVLADLGASPVLLRVGIGPAVAAESYQVGPEVAEAANVALGERASQVVRSDDDGGFRFDLPAAVRLQLLDAGVADELIATSASPTGTGTPWFSDRAARPCGRFAVAAVLAR